MPFWGGATLADVLAAPAPASRPASRPGSSLASGSAGRGQGGGRRLRRRGRGPSTGADLLAALDAVGAPEYPSVHPARPRARSWRRCRTTGRSPGWSPGWPRRSTMPPAATWPTATSSRRTSCSPPTATRCCWTSTWPATARRRSTRRAGRSIPAGRWPTWPPSGCGPGAGRLRPPESAADADGEASDPDRGSRRPIDRAGRRHVSDIYSLGMVLLEALSGRPPSEAPVPGGREADPAARPARLISTARAYAAARERPARAIIRDFEAASGRPIAPALRRDPRAVPRPRPGPPIPPRPGAGRGPGPLADRPAAGLRRRAVLGAGRPRWLRARRRMLTVAAVSILGVGLIATVPGAARRDRMHSATSGPWRWTCWRGCGTARSPGPSSAASGRTPARTPGQPDDREALEVARRALLDYGVLGPGGVAAAGDWRQGDAVRYLPAADREDLEVWLMERAYRYCRTLEDRPGSPADWRRLLEVLDRAAGAGRSAPSRRCEPGWPPGWDSPTPLRPRSPAPAWLDEHLLGVVGRVPRPALRPRDGQGPTPDAAIERALRALPAAS